MASVVRLTTHNTLAHICVETRQNRNPFRGNNGGYRQDLLEITLTPLETISTICNSCEGVMREPQFSEQGYNCKSCLGGGEGRPADVITREIDKLRVHCPFREEGCGWSCTIGLLVSHVECCDMCPVPCSLGCGDTLKRKELKRHENDECLERDRICEFCLIDTKESQYSVHIETCPDYPLGCPNGCETDNILRKYMDIHTSDVCQLSMVQCPYKKYGCDNLRKRKDLDTHETEFVVKHVRLMSTRIEDMEKVCQYNKGMKWEISGIKQKFEKKERLYSLPFYVNNYKFKGMIEFTTEYDKYTLGVFVYLCVGVFDDSLKWPFLGKVVITLVHMEDPENSKTRFYLTENKIHFTRRTKDYGGYGFPTFATRNEVLTEYSTEDRITIKIEIKCLDQEFKAFTS